MLEIYSKGKSFFRSILLFLCLLDADSCTVINFPKVPDLVIHSQLFVLGDINEITSSMYLWKHMLSESKETLSEVHTVLQSTPFAVLFILALTGTCENNKMINVFFYFRKLIQIY